MAACGSVLVRKRATCASRHGARLSKANDKERYQMRKLLFSMVVLGVLAGCSSTDTKEQPAAGDKHRTQRMPKVKQNPADTEPKVTRVEPPRVGGDPLDP